MIKSARICLLLLLATFVVSGCVVSDKLHQLDNLAGEKFFNQAASSTPMQDKIQQQLSTLDIEKIKNLTVEQKDKVDKYLSDNGLNRYGDASSTMYTGGTPLFNEKTGESIDRIEYILKNHPEILKAITN